MGGGSGQNKNVMQMQLLCNIDVFIYGDWDGGKEGKTKSELLVVSVCGILVKERYSKRNS